MPLIFNYLQKQAKHFGAALAAASCPQCWATGTIGQAYYSVPPSYFFLCEKPPESLSTGFDLVLARCIQALSGIPDTVRSINLFD
jgi:hypothetical protein